MTSKNTDTEKDREERLKGESSASGLRSWLWHRAKPYAPPWIVTGVVGVAGAGGHVLWSGSAAAGVGLTLASVTLTGAAWWAGKNAGPQRRLHSAITVAAGSGWVTGAALAGPLPDLFLIGGATAALSWNLRQTLRSTERTADPSGSLLEKVGLAKAAIKNAKVEPNRVTAGLVLEPGEQTNDDVTRALPRVASALDVPPTAVRYLPDPDSARRGELVVVPVDMLADTVRWEEEGPSHPGGSITDPLVIGVYDDGSPLLL